MGSGSTYTFGGGAGTIYLDFDDAPHVQAIIDKNGIFLNIAGLKLLINRQVGILLQPAEFGE